MGLKIVDVVRRAILHGHPPSAQVKASKETFGAASFLDRPIGC